MPARDLYHDTVKTALVKDGWTITHDPLRLVWGQKDLYVDLGAERLIGLEKEGVRIAVEVKSFLGPSEMRNLQQALGQFLLYEDVLSCVEPTRTLYLAVHREAFEQTFQDPIGQLLLAKGRARLLVFDPQTEVILRWIP